VVVSGDDNADADKDSHTTQPFPGSSMIFRRERCRTERPSEPSYLTMFVGCVLQKRGPVTDTEGLR
jgi:hypothetical protein